jgi:hypothetical protein
MPDQTPVRTGGCRCGQVRFEVTALRILTSACHCTGCQRMSASAFSLSAMYPVAGFRVTAGTPVVGGLRGALRHMFCPFCMTWMFTYPPGLDDLVNLRATLFDDARGYRPFIETYTSEKLPWAQVPAVRSFERFPAPEEFPELLRAFAEAAV